MDIFWNKQLRKLSYNTAMFYASYYLALRYGLSFSISYFVTNKYYYLLQVHKKSTRDHRDMLNIFCLFVLHIRIATIIKENAKFNEFVFVSASRLRLPSPVATPCEFMENLHFVNKMVTSFD